MAIVSLQECPAGQQAELLLERLRICETRYDFANPRSQFAQKEQKRRYLVDIADYLGKTKSSLAHDLYAPFFNMISANLFRALPSGSSADDFYDPEDDEPFLEPAWPHLQLVYELLRKFVVSSETDPKLVRSFIDTRFVLAIIELFDSEDPREREYLKTILHRIYGKIMQLRPFIRKSIMNVFYRYVFETHRHNGIAELLEILGSVINGFAVPLKEEHKIFLRRFLIPLHTPKGLPSYHVQLSFCITQFVEKEPVLAQDVVLGLVRHWPVTHSRKEVMLLNELEELLELAQPDDFAPVIEILFRRIARCIESPHFQVAERALFFWNNEYIVSLILYFRAQIMPIVFGPLQRNVQSHWNPNVLSLSFNVQKLLSEMDSMLYDASAEQFSELESDIMKEREAREERWKQLEAKWDNATQPRLPMPSGSLEPDAPANEISSDELHDGSYDGVREDRNKFALSAEEPGTRIREEKEHSGRGQQFSSVAKGGIGQTEPLSCNDVESQSLDPICSRDRPGEDRCHRRDMIAESAVDEGPSASSRAGLVWSGSNAEVDIDGSRAWLAKA